MPITTTVIVNPIPDVTIPPPSQTICSGSSIAPIVLSGKVPGTSYSWSRNNISGITGIAANGLGNISGTLVNTTNVPVAVTFSILPVFTNAGIICTGDKISTTVVVNPIPSVSTAQPSQTICSGSPIDSIILNGNVPNTIFNWTRDNTSTIIGIDSIGSGNISGKLDNTTSGPVTANFYITPAFNNAGTTCRGAPISPVVIVNPLPDAKATPPTQTVCSGSNITALILTSSTIGTVLNWNRNNPGVTGIANDSAGNIAGSLTNSTHEPVTINFTVMPSYTNGGKTCLGTNIPAVITVNPIPDATATPVSQTICSALAISKIDITGNTANTVFRWTRNNTDISGIGAEGNGSISGTLSNARNAPVPVTFIISPVFTNNAVTCTGGSISAIVVVNPIPGTIATPPSQSICSGTGIKTIVLSNNLTGNTEFNWWRDNTGVNGIANNGVGNISGNLNNTSSLPVKVTFTILPRFTNGGITCAGDSSKATVLVNPIPTINPIESKIYCNRDSVPGFTFSTNSPDSSFMWKSSPNVGFGTDGSGYISSFIATNPGNIPINATVTVSVSASTDRCKGPDITFAIIVNPSPVRPGFTSLSRYADNTSLILCNPSDNINFNINQPANGVLYRWSSGTSNVAVRDINHPNTVISFKNSGTYPVKVIATSTFGCKDSVSQTVNVNAKQGVVARKIVLKQPGNLLFYPDNTLDTVRGYQWGYDSLLTRTTLDTAYSSPVSVPGQVYQFFIPADRFVKNNQLDTVNYRYWVLLQKEDCSNRVYYNGPYAQARVPYLPPDDNTVTVKVFPNPNNGLFEILLSGNIYGHMNATIYNAMGQVVFRSDFSKTIPLVRERFNTGHLPGGSYYLVINSSDLKKVFSRIIIQH